MSIGELSNSPITVKLNGNDYKIQRLSISEIFSVAEQKVKQEYFKSVQEISAMLQGQEKIAYLKDATKSTPKHEDLQNSSIEYLNTLEGISEIILIALNKFQKITKEEIVDIITKDSTSIEFLVNYLIGFDKKDTDVAIPEADKKK